MAINAKGYDPDQDAKERGLIWIQEAQVEYKHAREWFQRRIDDGRLDTVLLPGTPKVWLHRKQVEAVEQDDRKR